MGYMNEFPHSRMFDSDLREILDMYNSLKDLPDKFIELKDYVSNYFKNLDIEDELDKKIEEAANSGELIAIIAPYLPFITPQMFGAVGDGISDDTTAFKSAIAAARSVFVPHGTYLITENLVLPQGCTIIGIGDYTRTILVFSSGGIVVSDRWITLKNISLKSSDETKSSIGISFIESGMTAHMCNIENILMYDFNIGIQNNVVMWSTVFSNIRINECNMGIKFKEIGATSFDITFTNVYVANCLKTVELHNLKAGFIGCNFSIMSEEAIYIDSSSNINFMQCNFECDTSVDAGNLITLGSYMATFDACTFIARGRENTFMFGIQGTWMLEFKKCTFATNGTVLRENFFNKNSLNVPRYGAIIIDSTSPEIAFKDSIYSHQVPYFINRADNLPTEFYPTAVDVNKCTNGMTMYNLTTNKLCYYNGTNIVDTDGTIVV